MGNDQAVATEKTKKCDSSLYFLYLLKEGKLSEEEAYSRLIECLKNTDIISSSNLINAISIVTSNPLLLKAEDYEEIKEEIKINLKNSKTLAYFKSDHNVSELIKRIGDSDIKKTIQKIHNKIS